MFGIGPMELILVLGLALVIFGPRKLPEMGKALGSGIREFRQATNSIKESVRVDSKPEAESPRE